jgi:hypothetical protein
MYSFGAILSLLWLDASKRTSKKYDITLSVIVSLIWPIIPALYVILLAIEMVKPIPKDFRDSD